MFFSRTAIALIVIAAGVLAYGLGDLQEAGLLPGRAWVAFDLSGHVDTGSWWVSVISGLTNLTPKMTVLPVVAWVTFLVVVLWTFLGKPADGTRAEPAAEPAVAAGALASEKPGGSASPRATGSGWPGSGPGWSRACW